LAALSDPNNPQNSSWINTAISVNNTSVFSGVVPGVSTPVYTYTLPDQIDGMDYTEHFYATPTCCAKYSYFDYSTTDSTQNISSSQTISNQTLYVQDQLVIKNGANVTFNNVDVFFAEEARLIIERGGQLTANNSLFTVDTRCADDVMWSGIEVGGKASSLQATSQTGYFIANNSIIEHAYKGVSNSIQSSFSKGIGTLSSAYNGGVIQLEDCQLKNCKFGTVFMDYTNLDVQFGNTIYNDLSFFTDCDFYTDAPLLDPTQLYTTRARLQGVYGIKFKGCSFRNDRSFTNLPMHGATRGYGIASYDSKFSVTPECQTLSFSCQSTNKSLFKDLYRGVYVNNTIRTFAQSINNCVFNNVYRSMYFNNVELTRVVKNQVINVPGNPSQGGNQDLSIAPYGMYLNNCDQYEIENNNFVSNGAGFGLLVNNSGVQANEIYRNSFTGFDKGIQAMNQNSSGNAVYDGLVIRCNTFNTIYEHDILITSGAIGTWQGTATNATSPANNLFSYSTSPEHDIWNSPSLGSLITYHYDENGNGNIEPRVNNYNGGPGVANPNTTLSPVNQTFNYSTSCPNRQTPNITIGVISVVIGGHKSLISGGKQLLDGGNIKVLLATVAGSGSSATKKQALLAASPYVTDQVLVAMIESATMNRQHINDVLVVNAPLSQDVMLAYLSSSINYNQKDIRDVVLPTMPLSTKEHLSLIEHHNNYSPQSLYKLLKAESQLFDEVLISLIEETGDVPNWLVVNTLVQNTPLSDEVLSKFWEFSSSYSWGQMYYVLLIDYINRNNPELAEEETRKLNDAKQTQLEIGYYEAEIRRLNANIVRISLFDEAKEGKVKEAITYLEQEETKENLMMSQLYLMNKENTMAQSRLDSLQNTVTRDMYTVINTMQQDVEGYHSVISDPVKYSYFDDKANESSYSVSKVCARAMLNCLEVNEYVELIEEKPIVSARYSAPISPKRYEDFEYENEVISGGISEDLEVLLFPNPASNKLNISATGGIISDEPIIVSIYDVTGKQHLNTSIKANEQNVLDITELVNGVYFCTLIQGEEVLKQQRIVVQE
jgi:hypothetical protein